MRNRNTWSVLAFLLLPLSASSSIEPLELVPKGFEKNSVRSEIANKGIPMLDIQVQYVSASLPFDPTWTRYQKYSATFEFAQDPEDTRFLIRSNQAIHIDLAKTPAEAEWIVYRIQLVPVYYNEVTRQEIPQWNLVYHSNSLRANRANPMGHLQMIPVRSYHADSDGSFYWIRVIDYVEKEPKDVRFEGKVQKIFFGFTPDSLEDYVRNWNLPWYNSAREARAEGAVEVKYLSLLPTATTSISMQPVLAYVPEGRNLLFRIQAKDSFNQIFETKPYFSK